MSGCPPTGKLARGAIGGATAARLGAKRLLHKAHSALGTPDLSAQQAELGRILFQGLNQLKGTALKAAQLLSLELGWLPEPMRQQLAQAHYQARPLNRALVLQLLRREFGAGPEQLFAQFNPQAFAAASFGQVHEARSHGSERLAVKLQYPGMAAVVASDMRLLRRLLQQLAPSAGLHLPGDTVLEAVLSDVETKLTEELDYRREADELAWFRKHLLRPGLRLPAHWPEWSSERVITLEYLDGQHPEAWLARDPSQAERDALGQLLWDGFIDMLRLRRIQADPHPGNFLCLPAGQLGLLDFGRTLALGERFVTTLHGGWVARRADDATALHALYAQQGLIRPELELARFRSELWPAIGPLIDWQLTPWREAVCDFGAYPLPPRMTPSQQQAAMRHLNHMPAEMPFFDRSFIGVTQLLRQWRARVHTQGELPCL
ncbi:AarF/UbiB family protein [Ideonella sp. DXS29W]|uniref:AarF/UbiB family protein n=1 Tax=Ideonella lacteola TaxID=2984193 RepID=A0ABU9BI31_9BURK